MQEIIIDIVLIRDPYRYTEFKVVTNKPAPPRKTPPHSFWRTFLNTMKRDQWFVLNVADKVKVVNAAAKYARGRYSLYQHPTKEDTYIFVIIKD